MSKLAKALTAAAGNAGESLYVEDVFSTYLYAGNSSTQTITNGIDLAGEGGLVWTKNRNQPRSHNLVDTERGVRLRLMSNSTDGQYNEVNGLTSFNSDGYSLSTATDYNANNDTYASWTFRKAEKFFDVLTYTGDGATKTINHNLGVAPACIIIKKVDSVLYDAGWVVYHQSLTNPDTYYLALNTTATQTNYGANFISNVTSTTFDIAGASGFLGVNGSEYVAYLFASDAGGFGDDGSESIIKCGSYTGNGSTQEITLGFEPQWILAKCSSDADSWRLIDVIRGMDYGAVNLLAPNDSSAELNLTPERIVPTATGFKLTSNWSLNSSGRSFIYIAIRRPMKTPESGTEVYKPVAQTSRGNVTTDFPVDMVIMGDRDSTWGYNWSVQDRLRGNTGVLFTSATTSENTSSLSKFDSNTLFNDGWLSGSEPGIYECFRRAPGFFDVVAFSGSSTLSERTYNHNLGVQPELIIIKGRSGSYASGDWNVATNQGAKNGESIDTTKNHTGFQLNATNGITFGTSQNWSDVCSTTTFTTNGAASYITNSSGNTIQWSAGTDFIAYLFATLAGVSKVGSYTGTAADLNIDCGFSAGARFILIKRTDSTGDWYVWDSARGIVAGNDPYLLLNSTAAEVTSTDYIDPLASGFTVTSSAPAALNASGGTYIFLAIA